MKRHPIPRSFFILTLVLVILIFLVGTFRAFSSASAASAVATATAISPERSTEVPVASITPVPGYIPGDTTGAMALAVAMVLIVLFGILWGGHKPRKRKDSQ